MKLWLGITTLNWNLSKAGFNGGWSFDLRFAFSRNLLIITVWKWTLRLDLRDHPDDDRILP